VYGDNAKIPPEATVVGEVRLGDTGLSTRCGLPALISIAKDKARAAGADAIYLVRIVEPDIVSTCYRITARLLRLPASPLPSTPAPTAAIASISWRRAPPNPGDIVHLAPADRNPSSKPDAFARAADAVVRLEGSRGGATGFIITRDGLALTSYRVVLNQGSLHATLRDGRRLAARVLRSDSRADVALIQIDCSLDCFTLDIATASPRLGSDVLVIGNPIAIHDSLAGGMVSGVRVAGGVTLVQIDAARNPGNSGEPIIDVATGQVVAIVSWPGTVEGAESLGFGTAVADAARALGIQ
jgi:S1-C subfamily serine protease